VAKNAVAKIWSLAISEDGWFYSGPPIDVTAPTPPVLAALTAITSTSVTVRVSTPSVDSQTGVLDYIFFVAPTATLAYVATTPVSPEEAEAGYVITGLTPGTAYSVYAKARDKVPLAPNISQGSNVVTGTTAAAVPNTSWFPNWPIMTSQYLIGSMASNLLDSTQRVYAGEKDLIVIQWWYPVASRTTQRAAAIKWIHDNYPGCKMIFYTLANETLKTFSGVGQNNDARQMAYDLIEGPHGNPNWYARTTAGVKTEAQYAPSLEWQMNLAAAVAGRNDLGETYPEAFYRTVVTLINGSTPANTLSLYCSGIYIDNCEQRAPRFTVDNGGTDVSSSMDFNDDGIAEVLNLYTAASNAGGTTWSYGALHSRDVIEGLYPNWLCIVNGARWAYDDFDGRGISPPLPLSGRPFYKQWHGVLKEHESNDFGIYRVGTTSYTYNGQDALTLAFRRLAIQQRYMDVDANSPAGRSFIMLCANVLTRTPQADDYTFSRFFLVCSLLVEQCSHCVQINSTIPLPLDEQFIALGNPRGPRTMGTLNESTLAWTPRTPDRVNGDAKFYWAEFDDGLAIGRFDPPTIGPWPSADAAVSCTLPSPGAGKKWQMSNAATDVSPAIYAAPNTTRTMRGQNTTLNNGSDVSAISLKPYHGAVIRRVNA